MFFVVVVVDVVLFIYVFICLLLPVTITFKNNPALLGPYFSFLVFTFFKVCFVLSIPHHICSSLGLQHKCLSETLSAGGVGGGREITSALRPPREVSQSGSADCRD